MVISHLTLILSPGLKASVGNCRPGSPLALPPQPSPHVTEQRRRRRSGDEQSIDGGGAGVFALRRGPAGSAVLRLDFWRARARLDAAAALLGARAPVAPRLQETVNRARTAVARPRFFQGATRDTTMLRVAVDAALPRMRANSACARARAPRAPIGKRAVHGARNNVRVHVGQFHPRAFGVVARAGGSQSLCAALLATMRWLSRDNELGGSVATAAGCTARRPRAIVRVTINGARVDVAWLGLRYWWARRTTKFGHAHDVACALVYAAAARGAARRAVLPRPDLAVGPARGIGRRSSARRDPIRDVLGAHHR